MTTMHNHVIFIGAGPGDPHLITQKAIYFLNKADVILYDYLAHPNLLHHCKEDCIRVCVGKKKGHHSKQQSEINDLLLEYGKKYKLVVRLKGGDPSIFGRLGEELQFCQQHNLHYQVIPGISSGIATPISEGIPITHRQFSKTVSFITGTTALGSAIDSNNIPKTDTLVFFMGVSQLEKIVQKLIDNKYFSATTGACIISNGTLSNQKILHSTLQNIVAEHQKNPIPAPAMLVVGNVVNLSNELSWMKKLPLHQKRCILLGPIKSQEHWYHQLSFAGAEVIQLPLIKQEPLHENYKLINQSFLETHNTLIFVSKNAVYHFMKALHLAGYDSRHLNNMHLITIGPATQNELSKYGLKSDFTPIENSSKGILIEYQHYLTNKNIAIINAEKSIKTLAINLSKKNTTTNYPLYKTVSNPQQIPIELRDNDHIIFSSPSTATHFF